MLDNVYCRFQNKIVSDDFKTIQKFIELFMETIVNYDFFNENSKNKI